MHNLRPPPTEQPSLSVDPRHLDFGEVWFPSESRQFDLPVTNRTNESIALVSFQTSCNCASVEPASYRFAPHETRTFVVTLSDTGNEHWRGRERAVRVELEPLLERAAKLKWVLQGTVRPVVETSLAAVLFGDSNRAAAPPVARTVEVVSRGAVQLEARVVPPVARAEVTKSESGWLVVVAPDTTRAPGPFAAELRLVASDAAGAPVGTTVLPIRGDLQE
jgi:hypothetical protein